MRNLLESRVLRSAWTGNRLTGRLRVPEAFKLVVPGGGRKIAPSVSRHHGEVVEIDVAVRFRPEPDLARDGLRQCVLEIELAVEITLDLVAGDADLQVMPLPAGGRRIPDPLDRRTPALLELPQHQVVL